MSKTKKVLQAKKVKPCVGQHFTCESCVDYRAGWAHAAASLGALRGVVKLLEDRIATLFIEKREAEARLIRDIRDTVQERANDSEEALNDFIEGATKESHT
jgi:acylphosphatase